MMAFQFTVIDGYLSLEEATANLVNVAKCMENTHTFSSASRGKSEMLHLFQMRRDSITVLLNLIEQYLQQIPESQDIPETDNRMHKLVTNEEFEELNEQFSDWFDTEPTMRDLFQDSRGICKSAVMEYIANQQGKTIFVYGGAKNA